MKGKWRGGKIYAFNMNSADSNGRKGIRIQAGGLMIRSGELTQNQQCSREKKKKDEEDTLVIFRMEDMQRIDDRQGRDDKQMGIDNDLK